MRQLSVFVLWGQLSPRRKNFCTFFFPVFLTVILYFSQRFLFQWGHGPFHVAAPYQFDKTYFGVSTASGILTPNEYLQLHGYPALDFICGLIYVFYFVFFISQSAWLYFGLASCTAVAKRIKLFLWSSFGCYLICYVTQLWFASAPPWYVSLYALGPARTDIPANAAGITQFDHFFKTQFFSNIYSATNVTHGATPSFQAAAALLMLFFAIRVKKLRVFSGALFLLVCFSGVYLNHHYVFDILWGSFYALLMAGFAELVILAVRKDQA